MSGSMSGSSSDTMGSDLLGPSSPFRPVGNCGSGLHGSGRPFLSTNTSLFLSDDLMSLDLRPPIVNNLPMPVASPNETLSSMTSLHSGPASLQDPTTGPHSHSMLHSSHSLHSGNNMMNGVGVGVGVGIDGAIGSGISNANGGLHSFGMPCPPPGGPAAGVGYMMNVGFMAGLGGGSLGPARDPSIHHSPLQGDLNLTNLINMGGVSMGHMGGSHNNLGEFASIGSMNSINSGNSIGCGSLGMATCSLPGCMMECMFICRFSSTVYALHS